MKKLLFIYNTHAGKGLLKSRLAAVLEGLARDWGVAVHPTPGAGGAAPPSPPGRTAPRP